MERLNYIDNRKAGASYKFAGHKQALALTLVQHRILAIANRIIIWRRAGLNTHGPKHALVALIAVKRDLLQGVL